MKRSSFAMAPVVALLVCGAVYAAEPIRSNSVAPERPAGSPAATDGAGNRLADQFLRSSAVSKLNVKNEAGEKIGTIEDLVVNITTGRVSYAALGFGGVLGIGEKLFAVPWNQLQLRTDNDEHYFVLNVSKDALKAAPGFDKSNWPNFADPSFTERIDHYYRDAGNLPRKVSVQ